MGWRVARLGVRVLVGASIVLTIGLGHIFLLRHLFDLVIMDVCGHTPLELHLVFNALHDLSIKIPLHRLGLVLDSRRLLNSI